MFEEFVEKNGEQLKEETAYEEIKLEEPIVLDEQDNLDNIDIEAFNNMIIEELEQLAQELTKEKEENNEIIKNMDEEIISLKTEIEEQKRRQQLLAQAMKLSKEVKKQKIDIANKNTEKLELKKQLEGLKPDQPEQGE